jgi:hypothetical protein
MIEFDEDSALAAASKMYFLASLGDFCVGARWQFERDQAALSKAKAQIERYKNALEFISSGCSDLKCFEKACEALTAGEAGEDIILVGNKTQPSEKE